MFCFKFRVIIKVMNIFVLQILTGKEKQFIRLAEPLGLNLFVPQRELTIRKQGKSTTAEVPVFPGYVFLESEEIDDDTCCKLRKIPFFCHFLRSNSDIFPLPDEEKRIIFQLTRYGRTIRKSFVIFNENDKIEVLDGPLKGLEGLIVKVDKRKRRAKVSLSMYKNAFLIDFSFELIDKKQ